jgi:pimeloyl-ACP methyl ester carboxylesterase
MWSSTALLLWEHGRQILMGYAALEMGFYCYYRYHLLPKSQQRTRPHPYRDYPNKLDLLKRITTRVDHHAVLEDISKKQALHEFLLSWFRPLQPPLLSRVSKLEDESSQSSEEEEYEKAYGSLRREDVDPFVAWAFFGKEVVDLDDSDQSELEGIYDFIKQEYDLEFPPGSGGVWQGRRLSLEDCKPLHRPLLVYLLVLWLEFCGDLWLRMLGFGRYATSSGLIYWYRPFAGDKPLLFFHGIAPAGKTFYIPMVLWALPSDQPTFVFENASISCKLTFEALTESETVKGVLQALQHHSLLNQKLSLVGHSFGSCPLTWLLHSELKDQIEDFCLLDPVTILLSEPDVMVNFLCARHEGQSWNDKIQIVAGSELFTEYYLRRHFAWYNAELWLEDVKHVPNTIVALSQHDQILNAPRVLREVQSNHSGVTPKVLYWKNRDHADCVISPQCWREIRSALKHKSD